MKFRFIWIGKTKDPDWRSLQRKYLDRISHFVKCEVSELKDLGKKATLETDGQRLIGSLGTDSFAVLLDVGGTGMSSHKLAGKISEWQMLSSKEICFIIGGSQGVSSEVAEAADFRLSLSFLTFTHDMSRAILLEQIYRAFSIINGFPYQK